MGNYLIRIIKDGVVIHKSGTKETFNRGDWIEVGRKEAMTLVAENKAEMTDYKALLDTEGTAVYVPKGGLDNLKLFFEMSLKSDEFPGELSHDYNLFLDEGYCFQDKNSPHVIRNPAQFAFLFEYLHDFDTVLILRDFTKTVGEMGREMDITQKHTFDNRVMSFQTCAVGIANTKYGREFYEAWQDEKENGEYNALVRALFIVKPTVYYLAPNWGLS